MLTLPSPQAMLTEVPAGAPPRSAASSMPRPLIPYASRSTESAPRPYAAGPTARQGC
ncbi:hypothetical protein ACFQ0T_19475 [Kitasatospora gansuensis]